MQAVKALQEIYSSDALAGAVASKNRAIKKTIITQLDAYGNITIADLATDLNVSTPKITSLINELIQDNILQDNGKLNSTGGRRANSYGLVANACFFLGVDVKKYYVNIGLLDFSKNLVELKEKIPYTLANTPEALNQLIDIIAGFISDLNINADTIIGIGVNLSGRINNNSGYSYSFFHFHEEPLSTTLEKAVGIPTFIENDSRSMAYGEFCNGVVSTEKNVLFVNLDHGTGMGILIDGQVYYGKSGFSGEFGHIPFYTNEIICSCGKKGCLETEVSGNALLRRFKEKIAAGSVCNHVPATANMDDLRIETLIEAAKNEDPLLVEILTEMGEKLGKALAVLINLFNPELVIIGGMLSETGDFLRLPARTALNKYSLNLVNNDTQFKLSKLGELAGVYGACLIARNKVMDL
ncbi:MAG: ROK family protein [Bacteroidetes bacterium]|nr:MAG: ROK family protein [Bacteroidota bacterium]TAE72845.1 MAG: ROK family protein [Bacteroidota bacterium]TAF91379.1 MAG: ROK family protein [Bacteroidota bacterium]